MTSIVPCVVAAAFSAAVAAAAAAAAEPAAAAGTATAACWVPAGPPWPAAAAAAAVSAEAWAAAVAAAAVAAGLRTSDPEAASYRPPYLALETRTAERQPTADTDSVRRAAAEIHHRPYTAPQCHTWAQYTYQRPHNMGTQYPPMTIHGH